MYWHARSEKILMKSKYIFLFPMPEFAVQLVFLIESLALTKIYRLMLLICSLYCIFLMAAAVDLFNSNSLLWQTKTMWNRGIHMKKSMLNTIEAAKTQCKGWKMQMPILEFRHSLAAVILQVQTSWSKYICLEVEVILLFFCSCCFRIHFHWN